MIGFALCGSFCSFQKATDTLQVLREQGEDVLPIFSQNAATLDTRFGLAKDWIQRVTDLCGREPILTIPQAEPLGPQTPLEVLILCPCTGNTLAKLALGITDTTVTMAAKAHLRRGRPLVIALASNDALSANLQNIARMSEKKGVYFVPLRQDDPEKKPFSLVCAFEKVPETLAAARQGIQPRPLIQP